MIATEWDEKAHGATDWALREGTWYPKDGAGTPVADDDLYNPGWPPDHQFNSPTWIEDNERERRDREIGDPHDWVTGEPW